MVRQRVKAWAGKWQEWGIAVLLFLALEVVIGSIERANWITPQPSLTLVLLLAVLTGWLLSKSGLHSVAAFALAVVPGAAVTVWQAATLMPTPVSPDGNRIVETLRSLWQTIATASPDESTLYFAIFLVVLTWVLGFISTWFILRKRNAWVGVVLGTTALLLNLGNLPPGQNSTFFLFASVALFLVGMTSLLKRYDRFGQSGYPVRGVAYFAALLICFSLLSVSAAWFTPTVRAEGLEKLVSKETLLAKNIEKGIGDFLSAVPEKQLVLRNDSKRALRFGDSSFGQGTEPQFVIISERPGYWRSRLYDVYAPTGWTASETLEQTNRQGISGSVSQGVSKRREMTFTMIPQLKTDILLTGGEFISSDVPVSMQTLAPANFSIDLTRSIADSSLPSDVATAARTLRDARRLDDEISLDGLSRLLPPDLRLATEAAEAGSVTTTIEITRRLAAGDVTAVTSLYPLKPDRSYRITSYESLATPEDLSGAGEEYPRNVTDYYQQLPPNLPQRIRQISREVTREARRPYDKVLAINDYLSQFDYQLEVQAPPQGADGVNYFLFTSKSGNCVQFASAMTVMLRSIGIPARVAAGYAPGEWDAATGRTILTAKERHAWPEVYFPGYGWVGFDPTPGVGAGQPAGVDDISSTGSSSGSEELFPEEGLLGEGSLGTGAASQVDQRGNALPWLILIFVAGVVFWLAMVWPALRRGEVVVRQDYALEVYRKMCSMASLARLGPKPQQTPLEYQARLAAAFPDQAEKLSNIVETYIASTYSSRKELGRWERFRLGQSWLAMRRVFIRKLFRLR